MAGKGGKERGYFTISPPLKTYGRSSSSPGCFGSFQSSQPPSDHLVRSSNPVSHSNLDPTASVFFPSYCISAFPSQRATQQANENDGFSGLTISATAKEFVPRGFKAQAASHAEQDRQYSEKYNLSRLNPEAKEFTLRTAVMQPESSMAKTKSTPSAYYQLQPTLGKCDQLINYLEMVLEELMVYPERYEMSIPNIASYLQSSLKDDVLMDTASDVIFEWAITQSNFSYTCARICQYISQKVLNNYNGQFNQYMLKRCHLENGQFNQLLLSDPNRACRFVVFLAELYTKDIGRVAPVMYLILDDMNLIVTQINDNLAKTVCQVMKMCGAFLEDDLNTAGLLDNMNMLMLTMKAIASSDKLSPPVSIMLSSVVTLRETGWGRLLSPTRATRENPLYNAPRSDFRQEPVFFSAQGRPITREEAGYGEDEEDVDLGFQAWSTNDGQEPWPDEVNAFCGDINFEDLQIRDDADEHMTEEMRMDFTYFEKGLFQNIATGSNKTAINHAPIIERRAYDNVRSSNNDEIVTSDYHKQHIANSAFTEQNNTFEHSPQVDVFEDVQRNPASWDSKMTQVSAIGSGLKDDVKVELKSGGTFKNDLSTKPKPLVEDEIHATGFNHKSSASLLTQYRQEDIDGVEISESVSVGDVHELNKKLKELERSQTCAICMDRKNNRMFLCGHFTCNECVKDLRHCHICREPIKTCIPAYL